MKNCVGYVTFSREGCNIFLLIHYFFFRSGGGHYLFLGRRDATYSAMYTLISPPLVRVRVLCRYPIDRSERHHTSDSSGTSRATPR